MHYISVSKNTMKNKKVYQVEERPVSLSLSFDAVEPTETTEGEG
jgi:hypothetical protein